MGQFSIAVGEWATKTKSQADEAVRAITIAILTKVVMRSPVGNPELWAANRIAAQYNQDAAAFNAALRADPTNLNRAGRLRAGKKRRSRDIKGPAGYVGGRFRGNWQLSLNAATVQPTADIDRAGMPTIQKGQAVVAGYQLGQTIFITNNLPYAVPLEYGHSSQAPAGMVRITVAEFKSIVSQASREVRS